MDQLVRVISTMATAPVQTVNRRVQVGNTGDTGMHGDDATLGQVRVGHAGTALITETGERSTRRDQVAPALGVDLGAGVVTGGVMDRAVADVAGAG